MIVNVVYNDLISHPHTIMIHTHIQIKNKQDLGSKDLIRPEKGTKTVV